METQRLRIFKIWLCCGQIAPTAQRLSTVSELLLLLGWRKVSWAKQRPVKPSLEAQGVRRLCLAGHSRAWDSPGSLLH